MADNDGWAGYVPQVRERYIARDLTMEEFEQHLAVAVKLDEGLLPPADEIPPYLRARDGHYLVAPAARR